MPNTLDRLRDLLREPDGVPDQLRATLQIGLVRELIAAGELTQAALALSSGPEPGDALGRQALATQWLALARALGRADGAEAALRNAAELDQVHGLAPLAQYLQASKRFEEAADAWRQLIALEPTESAAYLSLGRLYERQGEPQRALSVYLDLIEAAPSARAYLTVASRLETLADSLPEPPAHAHVRIALLGNATLDHLASYVRVESYRAGLRPKLYQAPFDQVTQEILNPASDLYRFRPDVVIFAVHASRLFPNVHHDPFDLSIDARREEISVGLADVQGLLDTLTQRSSALVLLHNMVTPQFPALGTLDWRDELGQNKLFGEINRRLAELVRDRYHTVYIVDEDRVQARAGKAMATDARLWLTSRVPWSEAVNLGLAREYLRFIKPYRGLSRKCIVLDLDNTLWGGVVGEDGIDGIQLGADAPGNAFVAFQRELERLWRRGILLALCSKNNRDDAMPVFERHPAMVLRTEHIAASRINWHSKPANLREIAAELNIGLDSLVFLDDNPVERAAVRSELPQVLVPELPADPARYRAALLELDVFDSLAFTAEDRQRGRLYAEQAQRREYEESIGSAPLEEFLAGLNMVVEIAAADEGSLPRIAQLTNKTNQFNVTTRRYSEAAIASMCAEGADVFGMRVTDRFGDNGLVGVAILGPLRPDNVREIDTLLLSCRVMGRGVETALLGFMAAHAHASGASGLHGRFIPTPKNAPARDLFAQHGFALVEEREDGSQLWALDLAEQPITAPHWLRVNCSASA